MGTVLEITCRHPEPACHDRVMTATQLIEIQPYDPRWPAEFEHASATLRSVLDGVAVGIDHIGSTAVPGLAAKDIIDVQITVADLDDHRITPALESLGATTTTISADHVPPGSDPDPELWRKRYFRAPPSWRPTHLHVRAAGRPNQRYPLLFRDYLRATPSAAGAYAQIKVALARLHPDDAQAYYDIKDPVCDLIMDAAEMWAASTGWPTSGAGAS